ncbi:MAG: TetR/AcrR family transcriptional regulator [Alphaproteobacteria bacterium]|nr:TetR/AcrR family transcriptional regulator [Alphaproteobacteria bacterium]MCB9796343.1 TetR/AcrR family transcriptional regulator [Alphaproteobacteria bacterium]
MPDPSPRRLSADESRRRLIESALGLYRERPPEQVPVRDIARLAGVNHGLVHRLFGGKQGLMLAVLRRVFRETGLAITERMGDDLEEALALGLTVLLRERWLAGVMAHVMRQPGGLESLPRALMTPIVRQHVGELADHPRVAAAVALGEASVLGWMLFEPLVCDKPALASMQAEDRVRVVARVFAQQLELAVAEARRESPLDSDPSTVGRRQCSQ